MRIEKTAAIAIPIPLAKDFGGSTYHATRRCTLITRIHAGEDGMVEIADAPGLGLDLDWKMIEKYRQP